MYTCAYLYIYICAYTHLHVFKSVYIHIYMHTCTYTQILCGCAAPIRRDILLSSGAEVPAFCRDGLDELEQTLQLQMGLDLQVADTLEGFTRNRGERHPVLTCLRNGCPICFSNFTLAGRRHEHHRGARFGSQCSQPSFREAVGFSIPEARVLLHVCRHIEEWVDAHRRWMRY